MEQTKRPPGRPSIGPEVKTRLAPTDLADLEERAIQLGLERSELIRRYIRAGLREDARRYWEVPAADATVTLEVFRGESPDAEGEDLAEWLSDHSLAPEAEAWLEEQGVGLEDPDVWALVVPAGSGVHNRPFAVLPLGTHRVVRGGCLECGAPGPADDFCDACSATLRLLPPEESG